MPPTSVGSRWCLVVCATSATKKRLLSFAALGLPPLLCQAAERAGWLLPTPIQQHAMASILQGRDVCATASTGSGKTGAYGLGLLALLQTSASTVISPAHVSPREQSNGHSQRRITRVLVIVPTRELAMQVGQVLNALASGLDLRIATVYGGVSINPQMLALRGGADIVVATTGRLLDLVDHNALLLHGVQHLVLDEVDRLLELGFAQELERVFTFLPAQRQNLWFSATFDVTLQPLADRMLRQPVRLNIDDITTASVHSSAPDITQRAVAVDEKKRTRLLRHLFVQEKWKQVLVFVATRYACEHVANKLYQAGIYATALHGEMSQGARQTTLQEFKDARWEVLVTTDLAARGIDIAQLPTVVNYDLPRSATDYIHRMGRTGRAGAHGEVISFVTAAALAHWGLIQKRQNTLQPGENKDLEVISGFEPMDTPPPAPLRQDGTGGVKGRRPSKKDKLRGL